MIHAHQPGSQPIDIPEVIPNPAVVPRQEPAPKQPAPKNPVKEPEKVPAGGNWGSGYPLTQPSPGHDGHSERLHFRPDRLPPRDSLAFEIRGYLAQRFCMFAHGMDQDGLEVA